ncbi:MAG: Membrane-bound lytic murein transglycosylase precursor [Pseudomonadota bacterium]|jgi:membrane-bound lytic murein transglycosylase D
MAPMRNFLLIALCASATGCATVGPSPDQTSSTDDRPTVVAQPTTKETGAARKPPVAERSLSASAASVRDTEQILSTPKHEDLIDRIRAGFTIPELESPLVAQHERWIQRNPEYLARVFDRGGKYLHHIVEELEARSMPTELALLPIVESAFNPQALSKAKAAGLWQFIPSTGRIFDLEQNWWHDQRRDVLESTRAALDYLEKLYELQGQDWFLALASYNWGEGAVMRARKRNQAKNRSDDYLSLKMPKETQHYVPKLIALRNVLARPEAFGLSLPKIPNKPYFVVIDKEQSIDLSLAARFSGLSLEEFVELNPSHHRPVISASRTNRIVLPADREESFQKALQAHLASGTPLVSWKPYTLKAGESLATIASRAGVSPQDLIRANSLKRNAQILPGTTLLAPIAAQTDEAHIETTLARFNGTRVVEKERINAVYHRVTKRDTLAKIAKRYGTTQSTIRALNNLQEELPVGTRLLIRKAEIRTVVTDERGKRTVLNSANDDPQEPRTKPKRQKTTEKKKPANKKQASQKAAPAKTQAKPMTTARN